MNKPDINILVNNNRCKFYYHEGKTYVEAKQGSEYTIEIKNNQYGRVEAVCSVDGLSVLTGKTAGENDTGYVVDGYHPLKIEGFRHSKDAVGAFKFELKDNSYAAEKGKKSKRNCGVIGIRLFSEKEKPINLPPIWIHDHTKSNLCPSITPYWGDWATITCKGMSNQTFTSGLMSKNLSFDGNAGVNPPANFCNSVPSSENSILRSINTEKKEKGFDMGTAWGSNKESKVITVSFDRGSLEFEMDIYYASRESLIEMGVPIQNQTKVNFPNSFPNGFAQPPKNWKK